MGVDLREIIDTENETSTGEPIMTHIIQRDSNESADARITRARVEGTSVTALCGHTWIPSRDPKKYPVCQKCLEIVEFAKDLKS